MAPPTSSARLAAAGEEDLRLAAEEELLQLIDLMTMPMVREQQQAAASKARALVADLAALEARLRDVRVTGNAVDDGLAGDARPLVNLGNGELHSTGVTVSDNFPTGTD